MSICIQSARDLQSFNTMAAPSRAQYFLAAKSLSGIDDAIDWCNSRGCELKILGGGSNVILLPEVKGLVLKPEIMAKEIIADDESGVLVRLGAGESWHEVVVWCLQKGIYGLENLALIPGTVGAAPVQNIGAYGVELSDFVKKVECVHLKTAQCIELTGDECQFKYRDSVFKQAFKGELLITYVTLGLSRSFVASDNLYPALEQELQGGIISPHSIFEAVCRIRNAKLPNPVLIPNCGSFFKNPIVSWPVFERLLSLNPQMPWYPVGVRGSKKDEPCRKLAAAWLIDQQGWKGMERHGARVHEHQALVITNPNHCSAENILKLADDIATSVYEGFGVHLELEPQKMS